MSINSFGKFILKDNFVMLEEKVEFAFNVQQIANKNRLGINQGGNISNHSVKCLEKLVSKTERDYKFELTDDPLDYNAEYIFGGYDFEEDVKNEHSFESRTNRVSNFLSEVMGLNKVEKIILFINIDDGYEFTTIETTLEKFSCVMIKQFMSEEGWTPSLKVVVES